MSESLIQTLRAEIDRLARRAIRTETASTKRATAQFRHDIAELKRVATSIDRRLATLEKIERKRIEKGPAPKAVEGARFSPAWLKAHRKKLGLSAADYAQLVGVVPLTIYNWEHGRTRPGSEQLAALVAVRALGKREAKARLEMMEG